MKFQVMRRSHGFLRSSRSSTIRQRAKGGGRLVYEIRHIVAIFYFVRAQVRFIWKQSYFGNDWPGRLNQG